MKSLLFMLTLSMAYILDDRCLPFLKHLQKHNYCVVNITPFSDSQPKPIKLTDKALNEIREMLRKEAGTLNKIVINKVLTTLKCAQKHDIEHNNILTVIDYSLPSNEKRLWVFDLSKSKLLFHTYVSHGIKSGALLSTYFSNKFNSKASSIGVYNTEKSYYGRHGMALKLFGLDKNFNDTAYGRAIVMHAAWYVNENFIKKYGRAGRSWGCPAVPLNLIKPIVDTIKDKSLFVVYYPSKNWFSESKFLNCGRLSSAENVVEEEIGAKKVEEKNKPRDEIFFVDLNKNQKREEHEPILVIAADTYKRIFNTKVPLTRMLRRQIQNTEYVALTHSEFKTMDTNDDKIISSSEELNNVFFVIPVVKKVRGYWATEMKFVDLGKVKEIKLNSANSSENTDQVNYHYTINFEKKSPSSLRSTNHFIRWLGL